jgi:hypothetical protein
VKDTLASPGWIVDAKYATRPKDAKEFVAKRAKLNRELGEMFAKFVLNSYSPEPTKLVNAPLLKASVWEIINETRKKRGTNGLRLLETLFLAPPTTEKP